MSVRQWNKIFIVFTCIFNHGIKFLESVFMSVRLWNKVIAAVFSVCETMEKFLWCFYVFESVEYFL